MTTERPIGDTPVLKFWAGAALQAIIEETNDLPEDTDISVMAPFVARAMLAMVIDENRNMAALHEFGVAAQERLLNIEKLKNGEMSDDKVFALLQYVEKKKKEHRMWAAKIVEKADAYATVASGSELDDLLWNKIKSMPEDVKRSILASLEVATQNE